MQEITQKKSGGLWVDGWREQKQVLRLQQSKTDFHNFVLVLKFKSCNPCIGFSPAINSIEFNSKCLKNLSLIIP